MVAFPDISSVKMPSVHPLVAPIGALAGGAIVAATFALIPGALLEDWVWRSGIPALLPVAAPPLGTTARAVLALAGGTLVAAVSWSALYLLFGPGGLLAPRTSVNAGPVVRRADAHPDAPPRRPMTAADLGTPLMEVAAPPPPVRDVPADLDQPMSAFDPAAIPDVPLTPSVPVAPLARVALAPGERIDTYVLVPPPPTVQPARRTPEEKAAKPSIEALLARLESHAAQRFGTFTHAAD